MTEEGMTLFSFTVRKPPAMDKDEIEHVEAKDFLQAVTKLGAQWPGIHIVKWEKANRADHVGTA